MDFPLETPETAGRAVVVRVAGMLSEPQLLVDGKPLAPTDGLYHLPPLPSGEKGAGDAPTVAIRLITPLLDRAPIVEIDGRRVTVAPPIPLLAYVWCAIPLVLLLFFLRGVVPALAGLALSYISLYRIRAAPSPRQRYVASIVINIAVIVLLVTLRLQHRH